MAGGRKSRPYDNACFSAANSASRVCTRASSSSRRLALGVVGAGVRSSAGTESISPANTCMYSWSRRLGTRGRRATTAPPSRSGSSRPKSVSETASLSSKACMRDVRVRSSPGVLRSAQQQHADHRVLFRRELLIAERRVAEPLPVLRDAGPEVLFPGDEPLVLEHAGRAPHGVLIQRQHRIAARLLVAGQCERVQRQRKLLGCRHRLLHQAADDADLVDGEFGVGHGDASAKGGDVNRPNTCNQPI